MTFMPMDRRQAFARGEELADRATGSVLYADVSDFTPLTESIALALGPQRGAEHLTHLLNRVYDVLVQHVHGYRGSVLVFGGDSLTCWFDQDDGRRATTCALQMQRTMDDLFQDVPVGPGQTVRLGIKVGITSGLVRRFLLGEPGVHVVEAVGGETVDRMATAERLAARGEVVLDAQSAGVLKNLVDVKEWREDSVGNRFAIADRLQRSVPETPWPDLPLDALDEERIRPWLLPALYERVLARRGEFLAELRPAVVLFLGFGGIEYDCDGAEVVLNRFVRWVQSVLTDHGGNLLHVTLGGASHLSAAFGVPQAQGDDTSRAVAAVEMLRAPPSEHGKISNVRIGLCAGRVYAGAYGAAQHGVYGIIGDTVNLAARLMQSGAPGEVLLSGEFGSGSKRGYMLHPLGSIRVKGKADPVPSFSLIGRTHEQPAGLQEPLYTLPIVGREAELAQIEEKIALARSGRGQVIGITGEAGIGKSRLVAEVIRRAGGSGFTVFGGECQSLGTTTAYLAWQPIWRGFFGLDGATEESKALHTVEATLAGADPALEPRLPLLAPVLGVPMPDNDFTGPLPAQARKQILEAMLIQMLRARAAAAPLLIVLEDTHWLDSLSEDLLGAAVRGIDSAPILLVAAYRPPEAGLGPVMRHSDVSYSTEIRLDELTAAEAAELISNRMARLIGAMGGASAPLLDWVMEHAQGNPFYVEEILNYLEDHGIDPTDTAVLEKLELPNSLQSLILSRIDRLTDQQQLTLKVASVIGRRFAVSWLRGAHPTLGDDATVQSDLDALRRLDLTPLDTPLPEPTYLFKHVITRDVAYESLTFASRERLHEQLAEFLERAHSSSATPPVDLLAHHYKHSANRTKEAHYGGLAGELAVKNGAYPEAFAYLRRAQELVRAMPTSPERSQQELSLELALGGVLLATQGQGSPEAKETFERARLLCRTMERSPQFARVMFGIWTYYLFRGEMGTATGLAEELLRVARKQSHSEAMLQSHFAVSATVFWSGEFQKTVDHAEQVVALYDPMEHGAYLTRYAQNPRITVMADACWALCILGCPDQAMEKSRETVALARELEHAFTLVIALHIPVVACQQIHDIEGLERSLPEYMEIARRMGNPVYITLGEAVEGWLQAATTDGVAGAARIREARDRFLGMGVELVEPLLATMSADACLRSGEFDVGLTILDEMLAKAHWKQQTSHLAEQHRLRGELLLAASAGASAEAEECFDEALMVAGDQSALLFALRAAMSKARLWQSRGQDESARSLVRSVYEKFTEGFDTPDLRLAAALLGKFSDSEVEIQRR